MTQDDTLDLIRKFESSGQNVPNYEFGPGKTAQGFYQITNTNWKDYGPAVGVDLKQYPNAMAAPEDVQRKVANHLLTQTPKGIRNWTDDNPQLKAALGDSKMPQEQQQPDYGSMSDEQLLELARKDPKLSKRIITKPPDTTTTKDTTKDTTKTDKKGQVKPPEKGWFQRWTEQPEAGMVVPGLQKMARGAMGYNRPWSKDWPANVSDILEGAGEASTPSAIAATIGLTGGAAAPYIGAGDIPGTIASVGRSLWPVAKSVGTGAGLAGLGEFGTSVFTNDPSKQRLARDVGGIAGGMIGPNIRFPEGMNVAPALVRAGSRLIPGGHVVGDVIADTMLANRRGAGAAAPTEKVMSPAEQQRIAHNEEKMQMSRDKMQMAREKVGRDIAKDSAAQTRLQSREVRDQTKFNLDMNRVAEEQQQRTAMGPQMAPSGTVNLPSGTQVQTLPAPQNPPSLPVNAPPSGTAPQGLVSFPNKPIAPQGPAPVRTPLGAMPPTELETSGIKLADIAMKFEKTPPVTTNKAALSRWTKEFGRQPTLDELREGKRIYNQRVRAAERKTP